MAKPKNMTPEQEAEWKEARKRYLADYSKTDEAKQKAKARSDRYREKDGIRARDNAKKREILANDEEAKRRHFESKAEWAKTETGRQKGREWSRRYAGTKREEKEFLRFMERYERREPEVLS